MQAAKEVEIGRRGNFEIFTNAVLQFGNSASARFSFSLKRCFVLPGGLFLEFTIIFRREFLDI